MRKRAEGATLIYSVCCTCTWPRKHLSIALTLAGQCGVLKRDRLAVPGTEGALMAATMVGTDWTDLKAQARWYKVRRELEHAIHDATAETCRDFDIEIHMDTATIVSDGERTVLRVPVSAIWRKELEQTIAAILVTSAHHDDARMTAIAGDISRLLDQWVQHEVPVGASPEFLYPEVEARWPAEAAPAVVASTEGAKPAAAAAPGPAAPAGAAEATASAPTTAPAATVLGSASDAEVVREATAAAATTQQAVQADITPTPNAAGPVPGTPIAGSDTLTEASAPPAPTGVAEPPAAPPPTGPAAP